MRLSGKQRKEVIRCVGEGMRTDEINKIGERFDPPFQVGRSQVDYYRKKFSIDLDRMTIESDSQALKTGLAVKAARVGKLSSLAAMLEEDFYDDRLWLRREKVIGFGENSRTVVEFEFNASEVREFRGILDDIAKEMGDRGRSLAVETDPDDPTNTRVVVYVPDNERN